VNRLLLAAAMVERRALRYTPAGLPVFDVVLQHESEITEAGAPRRVSAEVRAVAIGDVTMAVQALALGAQALFAGFLASARNGRGLVFHITTVESAP
jgi:primosomal replication protein N